MTLRRYWLGLLVAVWAAFVVESQWLGPWWRDVRPRPGKQAIATRPDWFHARSLERDGDKWGMAAVGYTDIDYEYRAPARLRMGSERHGFHNARINELGGRGDLPPAGPNRPLRVVVIGDSFAFGRGVEDEGTLAAHLRRLGGYDVINLATGGYSFWATMEVLRHKALFLNPDVILYVTYNADNDPRGLAEAREICEGLDVRFEVAFHPPWTLGLKTVDASWNAASHAAQTAGCVLHHLGEEIETADVTPLIAGDGHPSSLANQVAARGLVEKWARQKRDVENAVRQARAHRLTSSLTWQHQRLATLLERSHEKSVRDWIRQRQRFYAVASERLDREARP